MVEFGNCRIVPLDIVMDADHAKQNVGQPVFLRPNSIENKLVCARWLSHVLHGCNHREACSSGDCPVDEPRCGFDEHLFGQPRRLMDLYHTVRSNALFPSTRPHLHGVEAILVDRDHRATEPLLLIVGGLNYHGSLWVRESFGAVAVVTVLHGVPPPFKVFEHPPNMCCKHGTTFFLALKPKIEPLIVDQCVDTSAPLVALACKRGLATPPHPLVSTLQMNVPQNLHALPMVRWGLQPNHF
mmetsp:Transcript_16014/g.41467  ORF Transcript_16014/g.41467 Transcript_16014/m.41467 type:complete len:241 (+) Transcript_16014:7945-8667(+)